MSTGGTFNLLTNNGVQDKILMATDYLNYRIANIVATNKASSSDDPINLQNSWLPDINEISKTHVIFVNGSFKPFVSCGFEYKKVAGSQAAFGNITKFTLPKIGDFINDCVLHVVVSGLSAMDPRDRVRYVSMPGHKVISTINFTINGNKLDEYVSDNYNAHYELNVPPNKKVGWCRNMGQEIPFTAYLTADPVNDTHREYRVFGDGPQTFKQSHDALEMWIPLLFWTKDINNALPVTNITYGQTNINVTFNKASDIIGFADYGGGGSYTPPTITTCDLYVNNIFMNTEITNIFNSKFGFSLIRVHNNQSSKLQNAADSILLNQLRWPTEYMFIEFRPQSHLTYSQYWNKNSTLIPIDIKVPVAAKNPIFSTVCGITNITSTDTTYSFNLVWISGVALSTDTNYYNNYNLMIKSGFGYLPNNIIKNKFLVKSYVGPTKTVTVDKIYDNSSLISLNTTTQFELYTQQPAINTAKCYKEVATIDSLSLMANTITIFEDINESFYNSYLPYRFGKQLNTPEDRGWYMINFNLLPGDYQPSGHLNLSVSRETYLKYKSSTISQTNPADLIILSSAINFLLIKDGSAVLRYST